MDRILLSGDWHSNFRAAAQCMRRAQSEGQQAIVQLGDFGIWTHQDEGRRYLEQINDMATVPIYFLDGNHENFDDLETMQVESDQPPFRWLKPYWSDAEPYRNIYYIPRGSRWEWGGLSFLGMGGAYSIDKDFRLNVERLGSPKMWWWQETIMPDDIERAMEGGPVDIMLTHDAPTDSLDDLCLPGGYKIDPESRASRYMIGQVVNKVQPKRLYHGHYHTLAKYDYIGYNHLTKVTCLDCDNATLDRMSISLNLTKLRKELDDVQT